MAISKDIWERAKGYYEAGLSLAQIKDKTGIARNTISQRAKREHWEHRKNTDYIEAKEIVAERKGTILEQSGTVSLNIADEVADDKIRRKNLVYGLSEKLLKNIEKTITTPIIVTNEKGQEREEFISLDSKSAKEYIEAVDKASITLGINERHAKSSVEVNNTNAVQNNTKRVTIARRSDR